MNACITEDIVLTVSVEAVRAANTSANPAAEDLTSEALLDRILTSLDQDKAEEIVQIDLRGKTSIGDYMVIASGRSTRQVTAMAEKLVDRLKQEHGRACKVEGKEAGDWVVNFVYKDIVIKIHGIKENIYVGDEQPGEILNFNKDGIYIKTADSAIVITHIQFPNKKIISSIDAFNSHKNFFVIKDILQ